MNCLRNVIIVLLLCVSNCLADGNEITVKVMTFNIRYYRGQDGKDSWQYRRQMVVDVIRKSGAAVIGLQESEKPQVEWLKKKLKGFDVLVTYSDGKTKWHSNAIFYRKDIFAADKWGTFWLSDTPEKPNSASWGSKSKRFCTWARFIDKKTGQGFYFFNTHLDHIEQYARERSAMLLTEKMQQRQHDEPVILTGDFNVLEDNPIVKFFAGEEIVVDGKSRKTPVVLVDAFRVKHGLNAEAGTFHRFGQLETFRKIDYIMVEKTAKVLDAEVITYNKKGRYPSDHCPIVAELCFGK